MCLLLLLLDGSTTGKSNEKENPRTALRLGLPSPLVHHVPSEPFLHGFELQHSPLLSSVATFLMTMTTTTSMMAGFRKPPPPHCTHTTHTVAPTARWGHTYSKAAADDHHHSSVPSVLPKSHTATVTPTPVVAMTTTTKTATTALL